MNERILIADDEPAIRESVALALRREGFLVLAAADGRSAWNLIEENKCDLAVLDISMPLLEGTAVLARVRSSKMSLPIVFLTSRDEQIDRIAALDSGADDYISKPFSMAELTARIRAVLRRSRPAEPGDTKSTGLLSLSSCRMTACWQGTDLRLSVTEFRMLERLIVRPGEIVSRAHLMQYAFPDDHYTAERSADSHIKRLRRKLESAGAESACIEAMYGAGYRWRVEQQ